MSIPVAQIPNLPRGPRLGYLPPSSGQVRVPDLTGQVAQAQSIASRQKLSVSDMSGQIATAYSRSAQSKEAVTTPQTIESPVAQGMQNLASGIQSGTQNIAAGVERMDRRSRDRIEYENKLAEEQRAAAYRYQAEVWKSKNRQTQGEALRALQMQTEQFKQDLQRRPNMMPEDAMKEYEDGILNPVIKEYAPQMTGPEQSSVLEYQMKQIGTRNAIAVGSHTGKLVLEREKAAINNRISEFRKSGNLPAADAMVDDAVKKGHMTEVEAEQTKLANFRAAGKSRIEIVASRDPDKAGKILEDYIDKGFPEDMVKNARKTIETSRQNLRVWNRKALEDGIDGGTIVSEDGLVKLMAGDEYKFLTKEDRGMLVRKLRKEPNIDPVNQRAVIGAVEDFDPAAFDDDAARTRKIADMTLAIETSFEAPEQKKYLKTILDQKVEKKTNLTQYKENLRRNFEVFRKDDGFGKYRKKDFESESRTTNAMLNEVVDMSNWVDDQAKRGTLTPEAFDKEFYRRIKKIQAKQAEKKGPGIVERLLLGTPEGQTINRFLNWQSNGS